MSEYDLLDRLDRKIERVGGIMAKKRILDRDPPPPGLPQGSFLRNQHILWVLECAEVQS